MALPTEEYAQYNSIKDLTMKRIVILGAGESGTGAAVLAKKEGFDVFVSDMSAISDKYKKMLNERNIEWEEGTHTAEKILNADEIIKSPGIPDTAPMIVRIKEKGIRIISEIEFAGRYTDSKMRIIQNQTPADAFIYWNDDPIIIRELAKYDIKAVQCPFSELKERGSIGYIEEGQYKIEKPTPFNMEQEQLSLTGKHNIYNSLAAGIATDIAGIKKEVIRKSLSDFPGVEHRLEKVTTVRGVLYVNDSKATNVDACWYALESMKTKVVLIIGGKDKGNDYTTIKPLVAEKCSALVYLGADNAKLHANFDDLGLPVRDTHSMEECVNACYELAKTGETVLLSPCCASFDLFKNMEDRGEQFKTLVRNL